MKSESDHTDENENRQEQRFAEAARQPQPGFLREFWDFLRHNKKWWLTPIVVVLLLVGGLLIAALSSPAAPFIYPFM